MNGSPRVALVVKSAGYAGEPELIDNNNGGKGTRACNSSAIPEQNEKSQTPPASMPPWLLSLLSRARISALWIPREKHGPRSRVRRAGGGDCHCEARGSLYLTRGRGVLRSGRGPLSKERKFLRKITCTKAKCGSCLALDDVTFT